jgi:hypothetical protein
MAKFLKTTGVSYHLQQLIENADETLILISPFLKVNDRLRQSLEDKDRMKIDIRVVYGKNELAPKEIDWLRSLQFVRTSFLENLHAKCYLSEKEAILTSMNLYEFSQVNNEEMGIHITKEDDSELYAEIRAEAQRLLRVADEIRVSVEKVSKEKEIKQVKQSSDTVLAEIGFCVRCKKGIALDITAPYCPDCYKTWKRYSNTSYEETYCHNCGEEHKATMEKPVCYSCFKKNRKKFTIKEKVS